MFHISSPVFPFVSNKTHCRCNFNNAILLTKKPQTIFYLKFSPETLPRTTTPLNFSNAVLPFVSNKTHCRRNFNNAIFVDEKAQNHILSQVFARKLAADGNSVKSFKLRPLPSALNKPPSFHYHREKQTTGELLWRELITLQAIGR